MATPDEVRASLLASGDHGRDGCARRKLADQVSHVIQSRIAETRAETATAASAVVLASGLRAPLAPVTGDGHASEEDFATVTIPAMMDSLGVSPNRQGWRARLANVERLLGEAMNATGTSSLTHKKVAEAAAEIRAMIDGDGE